MQGSGTTYGILYVWRKYNVQVSIEKIYRLMTSLSCTSRACRAFFKSGWLKNTGCGLDSEQINISTVPPANSFCLLKTS